MDSVGDAGPGGPGAFARAGTRGTVRLPSDCQIAARSDAAAGRGSDNPGLPADAAGGGGTGREGSGVRAVGAGTGGHGVCTAARGLPSAAGDPDDGGGTSAGDRLREHSESAAGAVGGAAAGDGGAVGDRR